MEALDDSGVVHGDLKLTNILVFRTGVDSFTAKICDFGSATVAVDLPQDGPVRLAVFTPPWEPPETLHDIEEDDLYKVDIYSYGLLLCRIFLEGGDPFQIQDQSLPDASRNLTQRITMLKEADNISSVCKLAIRKFERECYSPEQLAVLDKIFDMTVRAEIISRADEHSQIKSILRSDLASEDSERR